MAYDALWPVINHFRAAKKRRKNPKNPKESNSDVEAKLFT